MSSPYKKMLETNPIASDSRKALSPPRPAPTSVRENPSAYRILLVEDNPGDAFLVKTLLKRTTLAEFDLMSVNSLEAALNLFKKSLDWDVILLDLNLPDSLGEETFFAVKNVTGEIPIAVFSGLAEKEMSRGLLDRGAYSYLNKDEMTESVLFNTVYSCLRRSWSEQELTRLKLVAENANREKTKFLGHMSHELRTPLTAILGFTDFLLGSENLSTEQLAHLARIDSNARHLRTLVNDLLDISRIQLGKFENEICAFSLFHLVDDVLNTLNVQAEKKGIKLTCRSEGRIPEKIESDQTRFKQILLNVIGNASKFTQVGEVNVRISFEPDDSAKGKHRLLFKVKDHGPGISPQQAQELFKPYSRIHAASDQRQGAGLGLALSKGLAESLGGNVVLEESSSEGCLFGISIAIEGAQPATNLKDYHWPHESPTSPAPRASGTSTLLHGLRILIIEDVEDLRDLYENVLLRNGVGEVQKAGLGWEGYDKAMSGHFDLVLLDLSLPDCEGSQVAKKLRSHGYRKPVIALSAHTLPEIRQNALESGFDKFLTKPVNFSELVDTIVAYTRTV